MKKLLLLMMAFGFVCAACTPAKDKELASYISAVNQVVNDYNAGDYTDIWKKCDKKIKKQVKCEDFVKSLKNIKLKFGKITGIDKPPIITSDYYAFKTHFEKLDLYMFLFLNGDGKYTKLFFLENIPIQIKYPKVTDKTTIDELAKVYISQKVNAGLAIGIMSNGKVSTHFYGVVKKGTDIKPDKKTEFEIGSITKTFTAIALLEMQEQGLLNVNDTISKFLPKKIKIPTYDGKEITLESLVTQTSGLPRMPTNFAETETENDSQNPYANYTAKDLYNFLNSYKPTRAVGAKYEYSNLGFGLLGQILALKAGTSYGNVIKKEICDKLDMYDTCITLSPEQKKRLAHGYSTKGDPVKNWDFAALAGCGAIRSTISDMLKYLKANGIKSDSILGKAIQESHLVKFHPKSTGFEQASGWIISKDAGRNVIWHNGGTGGYRSFIGFFEGTETGIVILSNSAVSVDGLAGKIIERLAMDLPKNK
jgi:serine-type D-Ala-D-Ala carboxypeptidase/endopeptidase